ncbi:hypothetical protein CFC35_23215 [Streptomyces sp. FBKL.4005]|uniref:hypothetical protein n=1 Tax=Streptomyces sp. FBKL.4005 TaxID=2015515 RepID=UPI000B96485F|nr:hypothetical protein [Streptomyces sp. FBKL.4005]OYP17057.1 hypothetical protein CFC35_23215 [Streptomyces sp. FBKL.4005]
MTSRTATASKHTTPDDQPYDFNLNAVQAEVDLTPFRFLWATKDNPNRRFTMLHLQDLDVWDLMEAAEGGDISAMVGAFRAAMSEDDWTAFRAAPMPQYKLKALFDAYRRHCGVAEGESPASSGS